MKIGYICRAIRDRYGYSQENVAEEMSLTQGTISMFENGRHYSSVASLWYIAHATDEERKQIAEVMIRGRAETKI